MIELPRINKPNQETILDLSKFNTADYATSEFLAIVDSANTILYLPEAKKLAGSPVVYVSIGNFAALSTLKVRTQGTDIFTLRPFPVREIDYETINPNGGTWIIAFKKLLYVDGIFGIWTIESVQPLN